MNKVALFTENNSSLVQESLRVSHPLIKWNWNQMSTVGLSVNPVATGLGKSYSAVLAIALHICAQVREFVNDGIPSLAWRFKTSYFSTPRKANRDEEMISLLKNLETLSSQGLISSYELQYVKGQIGILKSKADIVSDWFYDLKVDGTKAKIVFSSRKHKAFKHTVEEIFRAGSYECPTWKVLLSAIRDLKYLRRDCDVESLNAVHARMSEIVLRVSDNRKNNKFFNKKVYRALRDTSLFKDFFRETECCEGKLAAVFVTSQKAASRFKNLGPEGRYLDFGLLDDEQYLPTTASPHLYGALFMDESDQSHKALLDFSFNKYDEDNIISFDNVISLCSTLDQDVNAKLSGYKYYKKHIQKAAENARKIKEETWISRAIKTSPKLLEQAQSLNINIFGNRIGGAYAGIPDLWIGKKIGDDCEEDYFLTYDLPNWLKDSLRVDYGKVIKYRSMPQKQ